jgi:hypothetical protein
MYDGFLDNLFTSLSARFWIANPQKSVLVVDEWNVGRGARILTAEVYR